MSDWFPLMPTGWEQTRLDRVAHAWTSNVDKHTVEGQPAVRLCNYTDVYKNKSITADMDFMRATATWEQIERFRLQVGDTIITKDSETADDIGIPAFVEMQADDLVCGYHLAIIRPMTGVVVPRYLYWVMESEPTMRQWFLLATGVTRVGIKSGDLSRVQIALPSLTQQQALADYLDRETAQIDTLISEQQRLIALLEERTRASIDLLTWGMSGMSEKLQGSGIGPVPEIPAHWDIHRNKTLMFERSALSESGKEELLTVSHITGVTPRSEKNVTMISAESHVGYKLVAPGDLVINTMWAWMGALGVSPVAGIASPAYGVYRLRHGAPVNPRFLHHVLRSRAYVTEMTRHSRGVWSSRLRLYPETFLNLSLPVPPLDEQEKIVAEIDEVLDNRTVFLREAKRLVDLARERRAALITAAVTGQIEIPGVN